jgi:hypothetical protein
LKTFKLRRLDDETGISGTGIVAEGVVFEHGTAVLYWLTQFSSVGIYPDMDELIAIHGHGGKTVVEWDK